MLRRKTKKTPKPKPQTPREWCRHFLVEWVKPFAIVLAIFLPFRSSIADWNDVPTGSMTPTILVGDRIFVNKLAYGLRVPFTHVWVARWDAPDRGEIVVCRSPEDGIRLVKRIVAIPGDTVELRNSVLFINGAAAEYGPLDEDTIGQIDLVLEPDGRAVPGQLHDAGRPVALLGDDQLGQVELLLVVGVVQPLLVVLVVVRLAVQERDHVGVLLDRARLAEVAHPRAVAARAARRRG
jgi:signal peptidase I